MADSKITALTALTAADPVNDMFPIVDVSDTTMAASGTTKKISVNNILGASGTATLASATITGAATVGTTLGVTGVSTLASAVVTGDLTVRTNKLFVNATGVGIGNAGPLSALTVSSQTDARLSVRTTEAVFGITGGTALDSLNDNANALVPFGCRGSTVSFGTSAQTVGLQLDASSNVNVPLGNVVMGTSGKGIDFSATASGSGTMTSELLNDYEEGTWTATLTGTTTNPTIPVTATGKYTKIGRQVHVHLYLNNVITTGASGGISITGLPFTVASGYDQIGSLMIDSMATFTNSSLSAYLSGGATSFSVFTSISNSNITAATHNAGTGRYLWASITYTV